MIADASVGLRKGTNKIKVMHLTLSMGYGGLERIVNTFAKRMNNNRHEVTVCSLDGGGYFLDDLAGHHVRGIILNRKPGMFDFSVLVRLIELLRKEKVDIVHSHSGCSLYAALGGRIACVKGIIHTDHGRLVPDRKGLVLEDRLASMFIDKYVSVSKELAVYLEKEVHISRKKIVTIENGVDTKDFRCLSDRTKTSMRRELDVGEDSQLIGTVCRLDSVKNLGYMIRSIEKVLKGRNNTKLVVVGEGPERKNIEGVIQDLDLNEKVVLVGQRNDIERLMPAFDVFVLTSKSEGTSMTILEAMACEVPVTVSRVGGNCEIVKDGINGYSFPLSQPSVLVERVLELLNNPHKAKEMGRQGRMIAEKEFSLNSMLEKYSALYTDLAC
jgi:sugar transferase (PEP-CTERM/EpsH1 system associated)